jgi:hypothetical protein
MGSKLTFSAAVLTLLFVGCSEGTTNGSHAGTGQQHVVNRPIDNADNSNTSTTANSDTPGASDKSSGPSGPSGSPPSTYAPGQKVPPGPSNLDPTPSPNAPRSTSTSSPVNPAPASK